MARPIAVCRSPNRIMEPGSFPRASDSARASLLGSCPRCCWCGTVSPSRSVASIGATGRYHRETQCSGRTYCREELAASVVQHLTSASLMGSGAVPMACPAPARVKHDRLVMSRGRPRARRLSEHS